MIDTDTNFERAVDTAIRMLSSVTNLTDIEEVPTVKRANEEYRSVGLSTMGLHTSLAKRQIHYGSEESVEFTDAYFRTLRFFSLKTSMNLAKETGSPFYQFDKSEYADGTYLKRKYLDKDEFEFKFDKVKDIFSHIPVPTKKDWEQLNEDIQKYGLYNSYVNTVAPKQ